MDNRRLKTFVTLVAVGIAGYLSIPRQSEVAEDLKASLRLIPQGRNEPSHSVPMSVLVKEYSLVNKDHSLISESRFYIKARKLLKLSSVSDLISEKLKIESMLRNQPDLAYQIPSILLSREGTVRSKQALINSLAEVETSESIEVLLSIAGSDKFDEILRVQAVVSSRELSAPSDEVVKELWRISEEKPKEASDSYVLDVAALLSLGSIASGLPPERSDEIVKKLSQNLEIAEREGNKKAYDYIDAIGNSGSPKVFEVADRYILSPLPQERAFAASVLRKTRDSQANQMLLNMIDVDETVEVRKEATQALSYRKLGNADIEQFSKLMLEEPDAEIRFQMVEVLKDRMDGNPSIRSYLQKLLEIEENQSNYQRITEILNAEF